MKCSVKNCENRVITRTVGVSFHKFPKDMMRKTLWMKYIGLDEKKLRKRSIICSEHFLEKDIIRLPKSAHLSDNALPILNVANPKTITVDNESFKSGAATTTMTPSFKLECLSSSEETVDNESFIHGEETTTMTPSFKLKCLSSSEETVDNKNFIRGAETTTMTPSFKLKCYSSSEETISSGSITALKFVSLEHAKPIEKLIHADFVSNEKTFGEPTTSMPVTFIKEDSNSSGSVENMKTKKMQAEIDSLRKRLKHKNKLLRRFRDQNKRLKKQIAVCVG